MLDNKKTKQDILSYILGPSELIDSSVQFFLLAQEKDFTGLNSSNTIGRGVSLTYSSACNGQAELGIK